VDIFKNWIFSKKEYFVENVDISENHLFFSVITRKKWMFSKSGYFRKMDSLSKKKDAFKKWMFSEIKRPIKKLTI